MIDEVEVLDAAKEAIEKLAEQAENLQQEPDVEFINKGTLRDDKYE